ncbi:hypothetical protein [Halobaculum lipolyticum]|uniref:Uncharacterized protein n=1 Tax=Halobaculum lipolyticum TaxID=3032001 RepID=A0ABD5W6R0_9EURY|nr:hypothetical protein [Halobaculum sp. DT31]
MSGGDDGDRDPGGTAAPADGASSEPVAGPPGPDDDRYGRLSLEDGAVIVYDRSLTSAWIQSDVAVPLPGGPAVGPPEPGGAGDRGAVGGD